MSGWQSCCPVAGSRTPSVKQGDACLSTPCCCPAAWQHRLMFRACPGHLIPVTPGVSVTAGSSGTKEALGCLHGCAAPALGPGWCLFASCTSCGPCSAALVLSSPHKLSLCLGTIPPACSAGLSQVSGLTLQRGAATTSSKAFCFSGSTLCQQQDAIVCCSAASWKGE